MTRLLVTGGGGMVGSYVPAAFADSEVLSVDRAAMDLRDPAQVGKVFRDFKPDVVLHLAAATDVDRCQKEPDWAFGVNAVGTQNAALEARRLDSLFIYIGTGAVFPGERPEPYTEFDATRPSNVYAQSKLAGEELLRDIGVRHLIVRAGWVFGGGAKDKKFVGKLVSMIRAGQTPLKAVSDKFGTPTYAKDLLSGIRRLLDLRQLGTFHMGNDGFATRYEIAVEIQKILGDARIKIEPVHSDMFPLPAPRASESIRNYKLHLMGKKPQRPWQQALREYVQTECQALIGKAHA